MKKVLLIACLLSLGLQAQVQIGLQPFATGLNAPVDIANAGDSRLFVVEQDGIIKIIQPSGIVNATAFLNIQNLTNRSGEQGLLGLAFDPNYATSGFFYINYTNNSGNTVIARYKVSASNPNVADATSGSILLTVNQPYGNHNGGCLKFGPDGLLYIGLGDGGNGGDPQGYAQNLTVNPNNPSRVFLGKMLRLAVNNSATAPFYTIPPTNPFIGQAGKEEIWAIGLRNPWRFSFDAATGDLWIADVGQGQFEEINKSITTQTGALNYGWRCYEGDTAFNTANCPSLSALEQPLVSISHSNGSCSITGGYVYRGNMYPNMVGKYIFSDFCLPSIGLVDSSGALTYSTNFSGRSFASFGEDNTGELYVSALDNGTVYKITDANLSLDDTVQQQLIVTPNPASDRITINNAANLQIERVLLYDLTGKVIMDQSVTNHNTIDVSQVATGIYHLAAYYIDGLASVVKVIIE